MRTAIATVDRLSKELASPGGRFTEALDPKAVRKVLLRFGYYLEKRCDSEEVAVWMMTLIRAGKNLDFVGWQA